jgi:hypothetical protein
MEKITVNIVRWREDGTKVFMHTGKTFQVEKDELGLVKEHMEEVRIESEFPLIVTERNYLTADGKSIRNISLTHELIGLISDYYIYNEPVTKGPATVDEKAGK